MVEGRGRRVSVRPACALSQPGRWGESGDSGRTRGFGVDEYAVMAGWAQERLIAVRRATPAPGGDVTGLAREVAGTYGELAAFLPEVQPPSGDPERWAPDAVVKAGAAVVGS